MKKILALVLVLAMVAALFVGCAKTKDAAAAGNKADSIPDTMTSSDGKYEIAFVTDVGQLKDKSFNQGTYDGVKLFASENNKTYKYYQPANGSEATDDVKQKILKRTHLKKRPLRRKRIKENRMVRETVKRVPMKSDSAIINRLAAQIKVASPHR